MKRLLIILMILAFFRSEMNAQVLYSNGATLTFSTGSTVKVNGGVQLQSGSTFANKGTFVVTGDLVNNADIGNGGDGVLVFKGDALQTLSGSKAYQMKDVEMDNEHGVTLTVPLRIEGSMSFIKGIISATDPDNPLVFATKSSLTGVSDNSHVNGYVVKEGTGSFTYPVGDGEKYQKVAVNLTTNSDGLRVRYYPGDAGETEGFGTGGASTLLLTAYNSGEYWDINPLGEAAGKVTIHWDDYNNPSLTSSTNTGIVRVAHQSGDYWLNEGNLAVSGDIGAGSVTSETVSSWSPFTLGIVSEASLPVSWLSFSGHIDDKQQAVLSWKVIETFAERYELERSYDAVHFKTVRIIKAVGEGTHSYVATDEAVLADPVYYRILQIDRDGKSGYSKIVSLKGNLDIGFTVFPNPCTDRLMVSAGKGSVGKKASLYNVAGVRLKEFVINSPDFLMDLSVYPSGLYYLYFDEGISRAVIKR